MAGRPIEMYDAIVAGAGPAGLLLASKLPRDRRILIFDRLPIGQTQKFWLTSAERLRRHDLECAIAFRSTNGSIGSFLGGYAPAYGDYAVVDDRRLLATLAQRCQINGARIIGGAQLRCVRWERESLVVETSAGRWRCRLLVDATGGSSPIAATFRQHKLYGFFSVFGAHLSGIQLTTDEIIGAHVIRLGFPTPMFEVFPTGKDSAFAVVFFAARRLQSLDFMRASFEDHKRDNPFFRLDPHGTEVEGKMGGIPIGKFVARRLPGVFTFGEAGMLQSPLIGGAFNEALQHVDIAVARISEAFMRAGKGLVNVSLSKTWRKRCNDWLQHALVRPLLAGTLEEYERLVRLLEMVGPHVSYRIFSSELGRFDFATVTKAFVASRLLTSRPREPLPNDLPERLLGNEQAGEIP